MTHKKYTTNLLIIIALTCTIRSTDQTTSPPAPSTPSPNTAIFVTQPSPSIAMQYHAHHDPIDYIASYSFTQPSLNLFSNALSAALTGTSTALPSHSPTKKHLEQYAQAIATQVTDTQQSFKIMLSKAIYYQYQSEWNWHDNEHQWRPPDQHPPYTTFVHGQKSSLFLKQHIYTILWYIKNRRPIDPTFTFLHIYPETVRKKLINDRITQQIINQCGLPIHTHERNVIFMNYPITGNAYRTGESSLSYTLSNRNIRDRSVCYEHIFRFLHAPETFKRHQQALEDLERHYQSITTYGTLVLISFPTNTIQSSITIVDACGKPLLAPLMANTNTGRIHISPRVIPIITTLYRTNQEIDGADATLMDLDSPIFITPIGTMLLNPDSGVRIYKITEHDTHNPDYQSFITQYRHTMQHLTKDFIAEISAQETK